MALTWFDDFNSYGTNLSLLSNGLYGTVYGSLSIVNDPDPIAVGAKCIKFDQLSTLRKVRDVPLAAVGCALRVWPDNLPVDVNTCQLIQFNGSDNVPHVSICVDPNGYIKAYRYVPTGGVLLGQSSGPVILPNAWNHVE